MTRLNSYIAFAVLFLCLFTFMNSYNIKPMNLFKWNKDSKTAKRVKNHLTDMSDSLLIAEKTGDKAMALEVVNATTKVLDEFNNLPADSQNRVLTSHLRYCHLASINLADGALAIYQGGYWLQKDRFFNALDMCH
ncbi:MAG: hypothetical protein ACO1N8_06250 [Methylophilus sp.]